MEIAALAKAERLERYMRGARKSDAVISLTRAELAEFIGWFRPQVPAEMLAEFDSLPDWEKVAGMQVRGFELGPAHDVFEELCPTT